MSSVSRSSPCSDWPIGFNFGEWPVGCFISIFSTPAIAQLSYIRRSVSDSAASLVCRHMATAAPACQIKLALTSRALHVGILELDSHSVFDE